jgi:SSS family solute:Na+ symporter
MRVLYAGTVIWGALGTLTALALIRVESVLDAWWKLQGVFSGGMLGLFLLGIISRKAQSPAAATAVILGGLATLWIVISEFGLWPESLAFLRSPFHILMVIVVGTLTILMVGLLLAKLGKRRSGS